MRLLIDENVPDSTAKAFEALGHETIYVRDESIGSKRVQETGSLIEDSFRTGHHVSSDSVAVTVTTEEVRWGLAFAR